MTSPWPEPDYENKTAMCALCYDTFSFKDLYKDENGLVVDVCYECRASEILYRLSTKLHQDRDMIGDNFYAVETRLVELATKVLIDRDEEIIKKIVSGEITVSW